MFEFAVNRKYIAENPAAGVKHFDERRERPSKRMLTVDEEQRILGAAPAPSRCDRSARANGRKNVQRGLFFAVGPDGPREFPDPTGWRCENE